MEKGGPYDRPGRGGVQGERVNICSDMLFAKRTKNNLAGKNKLLKMNLDSDILYYINNCFTQFFKIQAFT